uniref:Sodium-dependent multivitamin transporter n=1 Tax=Knipowitschia caucasica TaxID=637954 RepID=A0AAV2KX34_KNICA
MPKFVFDIFDGYPGFPGLFLACAYSGTLSTASTSINAMAAVTMEDVLRPHLPHISQSNLVILSKALSFMFGVGCISIASLSSFLDWGVLQGSFTVMGVVSGPLLGVFLLGMFVPGANKLGAYVGILTGYGVSLWLAVGSTLYPPSAETMGVLPTSADLCSPTNTSHGSFSTKLQSTEHRGLHNFYSVSYLYFGAMATSSVVLIGLIVEKSTRAEHSNKRLQENATDEARECTMVMLGPTG